MQPAYPPGFALLTLGIKGLAGGCGEWLTQLLGCFFMALAAVFLVRHAGSWAAALWVAVSFLTPQIMQMGTLYYAEPLMALMALAGWERLRKGGDDVWGWLLLGAAGWMKNEGVLVLPAFWFSSRVFRGGASASVKWLLAGLALPVAWHVGCRLAGGGLYDFGWQPDWGQAWLALGRVARLGFVEPWRFGFVWPLAVLAWLAPGMRTRGYAVANVAVLLLLGAFVGIFSLSRAGDFDWHLGSMERLMWLPALMLMRELLDGLKFTAPPRA